MMTWNVRKVFLKNVWCVYRARLFKLGLIWNEAKILLTSSLLWSGDDDPVVPRFNMIVACWHASICKALQSAAECLVFSFLLFECRLHLPYIVRPNAFAIIFITVHFCVDACFHEKNVKLEQLFKIYCNAMAFISFCIIQ